MKAILKHLLFVLSLMGCGLAASAQQVDIWTSASGTDTNWSTAANWSLLAPPGTGTNVVFAPSTAVFALDPPNNFVDQNFTIGSLTYTNNATADNVTAIAAGGTLTLMNGLTNGVIGNFNGYTVIEGAATLAMNTGGNILIDAAAGSGTTAKTSVVDLSGLNNFTVTNVNRIQIGVNAAAPYNANNEEGMLYLAKTNLIALSGTGAFSTNALLVGWNGNASVNCAIYLGQTNTIFADCIGIGSLKTTGSLMTFESGLTSPGAYFRGKDGVSRVLYWGIGDVLGTPNAGSSCSGTNDFTGGTVDALIDKLDVGVGTPGTSGAGASGTLTFNAGTIDVNIVTNGWSVGLGSSAVANGTINANGGILKVNSLMLMLQTAGSSTANSTVNVTGATLAVNTIKRGTGPGTAAINLANATCFLTNTIGSAAAPIDTFSIANSVLTVSPSTTGTNISVGTLTASGANTINIGAVVPIFSYPAQLPIFHFSANGGDVTTFTLGSVPSATPPYQGYITNDGATLVYLVLTNGPTAANPPPSPKSVTWNGVPNGNWDTNTPNWTSGGVATIYTNVTSTGAGDFVTFDDSLHGTTNVNLTIAFTPGSLTVNNSSSNYVFTGAGRIGGATSLNKQGTASLTLAETGGDDFSGGITVADNGGTLIMDDASAPGGFTGNTVVGTNAVLQVGNNDGNGALPVGTLTNNGTMIFSRANNTLVFPTIIAGAGALVNNGTGTVTLTGVETFTGPTTINAGTLAFAGPNGNPSGISQSSGLTINTNGTALVAVDNALAGSNGKIPITINAGGTLTGLASLNGGAGASSHIAGLLTLNGGTLTDGGTQIIGNGTWDLDGGVTVPGSPFTSTISALSVIPTQSGGTVFNITNGGTASGIDLNFSGTLNTGTGANVKNDAGFSLNGNGTMALGGSNTYAGPTTINGGILLLNNTYAMQSSSLTLNEDNGVQFGANIGTFIMGGLGGPNSFALTDISNRPVTLVVGKNNANTYYTGVIGGSGALTKMGTGMLSLAGTNLYTGITTISNGTLQLVDPASLSNSPMISLIAPTAILDLSGRVDGTLTVPGNQALTGNGTVSGVLTNFGLVSPGIGGTTGVLTVASSATLLGTTAMKIDKADGTNDLLVSFGPMTYGGTLVITNLNTPLAVNDSFQLFSAGGGFSGAFSAIVPAAPGSGMSWDTNSLSVDGTLKIGIGPITGPSTNANITKVSLSGTNLVVHGTNNNVPNTNFRYVVLTTTNLATALSNWTPVLTNMFKSDGTFDYTNPVVPGMPRQFIDVEVLP